MGCNDPRRLPDTSYGRQRGKPRPVHRLLRHGAIVDSTARSVTVPLPVDNVFRHLQVRVRVGTLWSAWSGIRVDVVYAPPATPTLTVTGDSADGYIRVVVTNPTPDGDQPTVDRWDILRRVITNGEAGEAIRILAESTDSVFDDETVANYQLYEYQAVAIASDGTRASSAWMSS